MSSSLSGLTAAWAFEGATGRGVQVAVVDSGIDDTHPAVGAVASAVAWSWDPSTGSAVLDPHSTGDLYGHGTACAGIIRATAPEVSLHSVRVLGSRLSTKGPVFAAGLRHAIRSGARVVNLSLSTNRQDFAAAFHDLADEAFFAGVLLVCAVNNVPGPSFPSEFASVISVAANDGRTAFDLDCNPHPPPEFGAPGLNLRVPWSGGGTVDVTGNSFAAPHVSGLVALMLSKHPDLSPYDVKAVLRAVARNTATTPGSPP